MTLDRQQTLGLQPTSRPCSGISMPRQINIAWYKREGREGGESRESNRGGHPGTSATDTSARSAERNAHGDSGRCSPPLRGLRELRVPEFPLPPPRLRRGEGARG